MYTDSTYVYLIKKDIFLVFNDALCCVNAGVSDEVTFRSYRMPIYGNNLLHGLRDLLEVSRNF